MNISAIANALESGLHFVETLAPYAADLGVPFAATVGKAAGAIGETIKNVQEKVEDGTLVANSADVDYINSMSDRLFTVNTTLNDYIEKS